MTTPNEPEPRSEAWAATAAEPDDEAVDEDSLDPSGT